MKNTFVAALIMVVASVSAHAGSVLQVKDTRTLLDISDLTDLQVGDQVYSLNGDKKTSLLKITQIKGAKAVGEIVKGRAQAGQTLQRKDGAPPTADSSSSGGTDERLLKRKNSGTTWGLMGEMINTSVAANITTTTGTVPVSMAGTGFGLLGYYDYPITPDLQIRISGALEPLKASGSITTSDCAGSTGCSFSITYLGGYGSAKYIVYNTNTLKLWGSAGIGLLLAMSKSSSAVDTSQVSTSQIYVVEGGGDYYTSRKNFIPFSLAYGLFPSSTTVKASTLSIRVGYGWTL